LEGPETRRIEKRTLDRELPEETAQIAICFYAQKHKHFASIPSGLSAWVKKTIARDRLRIYNLAGNPMMVRLANGEHIHAVFEHLGQYPHDAAPGAFIGLKAGAHLLDITGHKISVEDLAKLLLKPCAKLKYVLSCNEELARQLAGALRVGGKFYKCREPNCTKEEVVALESTPHFATGARSRWLNLIAGECDSKLKKGRRT